MDFLHTIAHLAPRMRGLSPIRDDGSPVPANTGAGGEAGGDAIFFGTLNPDAPLPPPRVFAEIDPVAAKAYQDAVNALLGHGFAEPTLPDPASAPRPGVPAQRLFTLDARCMGNDDELTTAIRGVTFHKGTGMWGGVLDAFLDDGYVFDSDPRNAYVMPYADDMHRLMGLAGASAATGQVLGHAIPIASIAAPRLANGVLPGQAYQLPNGTLVKYTGVGWVQVDATGKPLGPYPAGAPAPHPAIVESAADHAVVSTGGSVVPVPTHIAASPADVHAAALAAWQVDWPAMRPALVAAGHGSGVAIGPPVRQAILAVNYPRYVAEAKAGLIGADGRLVS